LAFESKISPSGHNLKAVSWVMALNGDVYREFATLWCSSCNNTVELVKNAQI